MAHTIAHVPDSTQTDAQRITALEATVALLAAQLEQYRGEAAMFRRLEGMRAADSPRPPAPRARAPLYAVPQIPPPASALETAMAAIGSQAVREAQGS